MNVEHISHQLKAQHWVELIRDQQSSNLNIQDWCTQNNISKTQFYYWKRKLKEDFLESQLPEIVPLSHTLPAPVSSDSCTTCATNTTFIPNSGLKISIGDITIEVNPYTSDELIAKVIKAVRYA